ncbi:unnamed protein product [Cochlearia groenlandica]
MNKTRRSRGGMIAKLMPFCKAVKRPSVPWEDDNVNNYTSAYSTKTTSYAAPHEQPDFNNYVIPLPPKVSFLLRPYHVAPEGNRGVNGVVEDQCVDARASSYISSVRERFKMDQCERLMTTVINLDP